MSALASLCKLFKLLRPGLPGFREQVYLVPHNFRQRHCVLPIAGPSLLSGCAIFFEQEIIKIDPIAGIDDDRCGHSMWKAEFGGIEARQFEVSLMNPPRVCGVDFDHVRKAEPLLFATFKVDALHPDAELEHATALQRQGVPVI